MRVPLTRPCDPPSPAVQGAFLFCVQCSRSIVHKALARRHTPSASPTFPGGPCIPVEPCRAVECPCHPPQKSVSRRGPCGVWEEDRASALAWNTALPWVTGPDPLPGLGVCISSSSEGSAHVDITLTSPFTPSLYRAHHEGSRIQEGTVTASFQGQGL